jgi:hypothetical protein
MERKQSTNTVIEKSSKIDTTMNKSQVKEKKSTEEENQKGYDYGKIADMLSGKRDLARLLIDEHSHTSKKQKLTIDNAYQVAFIKITMYCHTHFDTLLDYAKEGYSKCGRGLILCIFDSYLQMTQSKTITFLYYPREYAIIMDLPEIVDTIDKYDFNNEYVLVKFCKCDEEPRHGALLMYPDSTVRCLVAMYEIDNYHVKQSEHDQQALIQQLKQNKQSRIQFSQQCSYYKEYTEMILQDIKEPHELIKRNGNQMPIVAIHSIHKSATLYYCHTCKKALNKSELKRCAACKMVAYCGKECQVKNWKQHGQDCKYWSA